MYTHTHTHTHIIYIYIYIYNKNHNTNIMVTVWLCCTEKYKPEVDDADRASVYIDMRFFRN